MTILLVDDDEDFRIGLAANLRDDGHRVIEFAAPQNVRLEALDKIDLTITDYTMTGEDGLSFANRFHRARPEVPVIMLTAYSTAHLENVARKSGFISLLHKPLDYAGVEQLIGDLTGYRPA
jgi:DNA-binding NtrC family response regulator